MYVNTQRVHRKLIYAYQTAHALITYRLKPFLFNKKLDKKHLQKFIVSSMC